MDFNGHFIDDCLEWSDTQQVSNKAMWSAYLSWCRRNGVQRLGRKRFTQSLIERGFLPRKNGSDRRWDNVQLRLTEYRLVHGDH